MSTAACWTPLVILLASTIIACESSVTPPPAGGPTPATPARAPAAAPPRDVPIAVAPASITWHTLVSADQGFTVRWTTEPEPIPVSDLFSMVVQLFADAACAVPLDAPPESLQVDGEMPHHGHGMNVRAKVERTGPGTYRVVGMLFHMPGRWELSFDVTRDGVLERAQTTVEVE